MWSSLFNERSSCIMLLPNMGFKLGVIAFAVIIVSAGKLPFTTSAKVYTTQLNMAKIRSDIFKNFAL